MTPAEFAPVLRMLSRAYPSWKPSEETADVWARLLADQDAQAIEVAAALHARSSEFPPTVATLIRLAKPASSGRRLALEAWNDVVDWIRFGTKPSDPDVERAIGMLGGRETLGIDGISNPSHRARFIEYWDQLGTRQAREDEEFALEQLIPGLSNRTGNHGLSGSSGRGVDGPRPLVSRVPPREALAADSGDRARKDARVPRADDPARR